MTTGMKQDTAITTSFRKTQRLRSPNQRIETTNDVQDGSLDFGKVAGLVVVEIEHEAVVADSEAEGRVG